MSEKKTSKAKNAAAPNEADGLDTPTISTKAEMKSFLSTVRDKLFAGNASPIQALSALQYTFKLSNVYEILDKSNKEIAKEIWVKLKQSGIQLKNPPILFGGDDTAAEA